MKRSISFDATVVVEMECADDVQLTLLHVAAWGQSEGHDLVPNMSRDGKSVLILRPKWSIS